MFKTPKNIFLISGHIEIIKLLISKGAAKYIKDNSVRLNLLYLYMFISVYILLYNFI